MPLKSIVLLCTKWKVQLDKQQEISHFLDTPLDYFETKEHSFYSLIFDTSFHNQIYYLYAKREHVLIFVKKNVHVTLQIILEKEKTCTMELVCHIEENALLTASVTIHTIPFVSLSFEAILYKKSTLNAIFKVRLTDDEKCFLSVRQTHKEENSKSSLSVKGLLTETARWWCENITTMQHMARFSHAEQITHALLLSKKARIQTIPALEVFNHDVHCKHGSAIAYIEEEHRFYMMSRGLSWDRSEHLIIEGFIG
jgi:hypothetical protein